MKDKKKNIGGGASFWSRKTYTSYHNLRQPPHQARQREVWLLNVFISPTLSFLRHPAIMGSPIATILSAGPVEIVVKGRNFCQTRFLVNCYIVCSFDIFGFLFDCGFRNTLTPMCCSHCLFLSLRETGVPKLHLTLLCKKKKEKLVPSVQLKYSREY